METDEQAGTANEETSKTIKSMQWAANKRESLQSSFHTQNYINHSEIIFISDLLLAGLNHWNAIHTQAKKSTLIISTKIRPTVHS